MKRWLILSVVSCLVVSGAATAAVQQGDTELDALGAWMSQSGEGVAEDFDTFFLMARLGYFLTDNVQVSGLAFGSWNESGFTLSETFEEGEVTGTAQEKTTINVDAYGLGAGVKYHFMPTNQWVPYIGVQAAWVDTEVEYDAKYTETFGDEVFSDREKESVDADGWMWGPTLGLRYELNAYNDFFVEYQYHIWSGDIGDILDDGHGLFVGLIHQFK